MSDSNPPAMDTSKLRLGDVLAEGDSAAVWNVTISKKDSEGNDTDEAYILKMFKSDEAFINEATAYERMTDISALEDCVPRYYGIVPHIPRSILLSTHDGENLEGRVMGLPQKMRDDFRSEVTKTMKVLHECGISHGKITAKNVIVRAGAKVKLVNFADAAFEEDVEEYEWHNCMAMDECNVKGIFHKAEVAEAHKEITLILEKARGRIPLVYPQEQLAKLLEKMGHPGEAVLRSIMDVYKHPNPYLAFRLAECLTKYYHHYTEGIEILTEAASRFDPALVAIKQNSSAWTAKMKIFTARYMVKLEDASMDDALPRSHGLYEDAIDFYLRFVDVAKPADDLILDLRYELATHLHGLSLSREGHAMDVCVRTLEEAIEARREVPVEFLKKFAELIEATKEDVARDLHEIKVHMWEGEECEWAPWARLPSLEQAFHRGTEARRLCNYLWASQCMEDPRMIWALPVDSMLEDYA